jgi:Mrp family chromosome partitioning ATPase
LVVLSGKGGVGKSTIAVNLATALAMDGHQVGLLDVDLHGPSIPTMLNLADTRLDIDDGRLVPASYHGLKVVSIGFLLEHPDNAVIWRGPAKAGVIKQLVEEVTWGDLDYLVVDCPPGTGDEPLSVIQSLDTVDGAVVVTTPQDDALTDVRKSITFCEKMNVMLFGVIENMSGLVCPHCGEVIAVFKSGGGEKMAAEMGVPFLGRLPMDPQVVNAGDDGTPFVRAYMQSAVTGAMTDIVQNLLQTCEAPSQNQAMLLNKETTMRFAVPLADGQLCMHFGHCDQFALMDVDTASKQITDTKYLTPPPHEPSIIPNWLREQGATAIIAGGIGRTCTADLRRKRDYCGDRCSGRQSGNTGNCIPARNTRYRRKCLRPLNQS